MPKATNEMKFLQPQAGFMVFSTNEVRFKGVRARPVGGAGAHAPEEVHLHERSEVVRSFIEQREVVWFFLLV